MTDPIYDKLADAVNATTGYPCVKCPELLAVLEDLYTPEEAELAVQMPLGFVAAETLARDISRDPKEVERILEGLVDKGHVRPTTEPGQVREYALSPLLPGTFELQFMRGETDDHAKKLARLFQDYFDAITKLEPAEPRRYSEVPFFRVITVEQDIPAGVQIHPYDKVSDYIAQSEVITISTCYCRHFGELLGNPCSKPKENCFSFGTQAKYFADRGFGKAVSKQEALKILDEAEKAGLVHCSSNTSESILFMCNCCSCHCGIMRSIQTADRPNAAASSSFIMSVDEEQCMGCGDCLDRCQVFAITMEGDKVVRDTERCIGCGLCISVCTTEALKLVPREGAPLPLSDLQELGAATLASYQQQNK